MMNGFKNKWEKALSLILCVIIAVNCNVLSVYATEGDENETSDDPIIVVSMGDSYSSGEGVIDDDGNSFFYGQNEDTSDKVKNQDWLGHRSEKSWSAQLTIDGLDGELKDHKDKNWFFVASSGAVTDNLLKTQVKEYDKDGISGKAYMDPQLDVFEQFEKDTVDYVTFTFGGNDVGFSSIITTAVKDTLLAVPYINPRKLTESLNDTWDEFYANGGTEESIKRAYENISDKAGVNAKIIVAGYPKLLEQKGRGALFTKDQAQEINSNVTKFNKALEKIVDSCHENGMKIYFVPVEEAFDGHEAYAKDEDQYINKIIFRAQAEDLTGDMPSAYSIHPNAKGAEAYAGCVQKKINEIEAGLEEETEEQIDDDSEKSDIQKKIDEEVEKQQQRALEWLEKKLEERLNQWLIDNCSGC